MDAHYVTAHRTPRHRTTVRFSVLAAVVAATLSAAALLTAATARAAPGDYHFVQKWGSFGTAPNEFRNPNALALDPPFLYVLEWVGHRVSNYSLNGDLALQWGSVGLNIGQFLNPLGIAVNTQSHQVYVADTSNHRIQRFNSSGGWTGVWGALGTGNGMFNSPTGVAVAPGGTVYVTDRSNHRVQRFNANGIYQGQWGSFGTGNGQFDAPWGIAVNPTNGNVYVVDKDNHRIQYFTATGGFIGKWGSFGFGPSNLNNPRGIAIDTDGNVYVADTGNQRVKKFSPTGTLLNVVGTSAGPSSADGEFHDPFGVAVLGPGNTLFVSEEDNHRVQKFVRDLTPPVSTLSGAPTQDWVNTDVTITLSATDDLAGVDVVQYRLGTDASFSTYTAPLVYTTDGVRTLIYRAVDKDGNAESLKSLTFRIDKTGPVTRALRDLTVRRNAKATFRYRVNDLAPEVKVKIGIYRKGVLKKTFTLQPPTNSNRSFVWAKATLPRGLYKWKVFATDLAGNKQSQIGTRSLSIR